MRSCPRIAPLAELCLALALGVTWAGRESKAADWPTAAGNFRRTRSTPEEVRPPYNLKWVRHFNDEMIPPWIEPVIAGEAVYVSTGKGLVALEARTGKIRWRKDITPPPGHAPTVADGRVYVGCMDRRVYALDAKTGDVVWTFTGGAGFMNCPVVAEGLVIIGCRDGRLYAIDQRSGEQRWAFRTGGPIMFSPAYDRDEGGRGAVFIGSNDMRAYAVEAATGRQIWKSEKVPGEAMCSYWPVVGKNHLVYVVFPGGDQVEWSALRPLCKGLKPGPAEVLWTEGQKRVREFLKKRPYLQTLIIMSRKTGAFEPVPTVPVVGENGPSRTPPAIGNDGLAYIMHGLRARQGESGITHGIASPFDLETGQLLPITFGIHCPGDEPSALTIGGNIIYGLHMSYDGPSAGYFDMKAKKKVGRLPTLSAREKTEAGLERVRWYGTDSFGQQYAPKSENPLTDKSGISIANGRLFYNPWNSIVCLEGGR